MFKNAVPNYAFLNSPLTWLMIFKEKHYWSTSQTSHIDCKSGMNKSFFPLPLSPPLWQSVCTISAPVRPIWVVAELNYRSLRRDIWSSDCWTQGPPGHLQGTRPDSETSLLFHIFIHLFINPWEPAQKKIMCVTALSMEKFRSGCFTDNQPAVQQCASHCNQQWWSDGCSDALTHCFLHLCSLLTCPMAPAYYSMNFVIPQEQPEPPPPPPSLPTPPHLPLVQ